LIKEIKGIGDHLLLVTLVLDYYFRIEGL
jgi:hypothetical protein